MRYQFQPTSVHTFQPSPHSQQPYGFIPIIVGAIAGTTAIAGSVIQGVQQKKAQQASDPMATASVYKQKYMACKAKREAKGKQAYPQDSSTSVFSTNCHVEYKKWKEWEAQSGPIITPDMIEAPIDKGAPGKPVGYTTPILLGSVVLLSLGAGYYFLLKK